MKILLPLLFIFVFTKSNAQYLQNDTIYFDIPNDTLARLWDSKDYNHTDIDLKNKAIINDYYVFENDIIFAVDDSLSFEIGSYDKRNLYFDKHYKLSKPLFNRIEITEIESKKSAKVRTKADHIIFEDPHNMLTDVIKLWLSEKCIRRLLNREEAEGFISEIFIGVGSSL
ncbi:hypothetical protein SAMN02927937_01806 [Paenimyroides aquimaris]|uniref:DUF4468 domain-containing protein n=1 Tax=Paenimyroides marinum TaxID=1159016 RepID=A0A1H6LIE5_9FLAO|nr:hypothetical protein [Paenimyroides aquimaris]SEH86000.1 hypothetical protein SAMN02927937_01806 [Paenimyroides aquimaris]